jgi:purine-binding chemotaxis protein CheW
MEKFDRDIRFAETQVNLACFDVGGCLYALDVLQVQEIVRCQETTPLPKAPALIEGVIDLRGSVIPVLDLGTALGLGPVGDDARARILVVDCDGLTLGLRVSAAVDVLSLSSHALEDPPAVAVQAGYEAVRAVIRRDGEPPIMMLSLEFILESVYRSSSSEVSAEIGGEAS